MKLKKTFLSMIILLLLTSSTHVLGRADMAPGTSDQEPVPEPESDDKHHPSLREECLKIWNNLIQDADRLQKLPPVCLRFVEVTGMSLNDTLGFLKHVGGDVATAMEFLHIHSTTESVKQDILQYVKVNEQEFSHEALSSVASFVLERYGHSVNTTHLENIGPLIRHLGADVLRHVDHGAFDYILDSITNMSQVFNNDTGTPQNSTNFDAIYHNFAHNPQFLLELCKLAFSFPDPISTVGRQNMKRLAWLLPCAPARVCKNVDTTTLTNNLDLFSDLPWSCGDAKIHTPVEWLRSEDARMFLRRGAACGRALVKRANLPLTNWDTYKNLGFMMKCAPRSHLKVVFNNVTCDVVANTIKEFISSGVVNSQVVRIVSRRCLTQDPANFNCTSLLGYGAAASGLPMSFYRNINTAELCTDECFNNLMTVDLPDKVKRFVSRKCRSTITFDSNRARQMGGGVVDLPMDIIKNIDPADIASIIQDIKQHEKKGKRRDPRKKAALRQIAKKLKSSGSISNIMDSKDIVKELSIKDLRSSVTNVVQDLGLNNSTADPHFSDFQNKFLMKRVLESDTPENMTADGVRNLKTLVTGMVSSQIDILNPYERTSIAIALCQQTHWPLKSARTILKSLILPPLQEINSTHPLAAMSPLEVSNIGCECLMYLDPTEVAGTSGDVCQSICGSIGSCSRFQCLNPEHRNRMKQACFTCMQIGDSGTISTDVMSTLGNSLLQQLNPAELTDRISSSELPFLLSYFSQGCLDREQRQALKDRIVAVFGSPSTWTEEFVESIKEVAYILGGVNLNNIDMALASDALNDMINAAIPVTDDEVEHEKCCEQWQNTADREHKETLIREVLDFGKNVQLDSSAKRKKRSATLTCANVMDMGMAVLTVTDAELQSMSATDFTECLSTFGQIDGWTTEQRTLLYDKATTDIGNVCSVMTSSDLANLGSLAVAIPVADIQCLNLDADSMVALGQQYGWSDQQLTALAARYTTVNSNSVGTFTSDDLSTLGYAICGFTGTQLATLSPTVLSESGAQLGQLQACNSDALQALATVALHTDAYGSTSSWDASTLSEVGLLTAGLSPTSLQDIPTASIEGITPLAISNISPWNLAVMSSGQLQELSEDQANAVTDTQMSALSTDKQNILLTAIYGTYAVLNQPSGPTTPGSGGERILSILSITTLVWSVLCSHAVLSY